MKKVGVLLGSFDPIHIGHMSLVTTVLNSGLVEKVDLVPSYWNPWKKKQPIPFNSRYQMCCLAVNDIPNIEVCKVEKILHDELGKDQINSYITLNRVKEWHKNKGEQIYIIVSSETFNEIKLWEEGDKIIKENDFIIMQRKDIDLDWRQAAATKSHICISDFVRTDISSTIVRKLLKENKIAIPWIPKEISQYIDDNNLYK